ncbi:methyl-accepting chemotaxis protein, partial [Pseudomonas syringae]|nr:methyl-accepting chemotaxis protein [Pseudomonas syringae]
MTWFLNLRLAAKLSISFLICALITIAIGLVGMNGNSRLGDAISSVFSNNITSINKVNEALQQVIYHNRDLYLLLAQKAGGAAEGELATTQKSLSDRQRAVEKAFAIYRSTPLRDDEKALGDNFERDWPA